MSKFGPKSVKAIFTILILSRGEKTHLDWERLILILSTAVTIGLIAIYVWGKTSSRW